jgi:hypothetical protein
VIESFFIHCRSRVLAGCAAVCLSVAAGLVYVSHALPGADSYDEELMYFPSGRFLKEASLGHEMLVADMAWLRAIQYYGKHRQTDQDYSMAAHIFDVVTTLDPRFRNAYLFGALVLAQDANEVDKGIELLHRGMSHLPGDWLLPFEAGFIYYICSADMPQAHRWFMEAAARPGHPESVERFAAFTADRSGDPRKALQLWLQLYECTENDYVRQMAEERVKELMKRVEADKQAGVG